jgi:hypothetical protein
MRDFEMTLADLFSGAALAGAQRLGREEELAALKEALEKETDVLEWPAVERRIVEEVAALLRLPFREIMFKAWEKEQGIEEALDASRDTPEETILLPLSEHTISSEHHPRIELRVNDRLIHTIALDIAIHIELDGCVLTIRDGRVLQADIGSCKAGATVAYGDIILLERESEPLALPGTIHFGEAES